MLEMAWKLRRAVLPNSALMVTKSTLPVRSKSAVGTPWDVVLWRVLRVVLVEWSVRAQCVLRACFCLFVLAQVDVE